MMRRILPILLFLALAYPALAETAPCAPSPADTGLPGVVAELEGGAVELAPVEGPEVTDTACSATAFCHDGSTRQCSTSGSGTCQGVNSNCSSGQKGYARCGSSYYYCPTCSQPSDCEQGASCGRGIGVCGQGSSHPGICYQGSCRCYCTPGSSCSTNADCGPANSGGVCSGGSCYCY